MLGYEGISEVQRGYFAYGQDGASPWFLAILPDENGCVSTTHVIRSLERATPYIDMQQRLLAVLRARAHEQGAITAD